MIGVINYGAGNIASIKCMLQHLQYDFTILDVPDKVSLQISTVLLPGVGDGAYMMKMLVARGWDSWLQQWTREGNPLLGICVGAQVLLSFTEEGYVDCLGIIEGVSKSFEYSFKETSRDASDVHLLKIPHMGWNELRFNSDIALFRGMPEHVSVYFVHSYYLSCKNENDVFSTTDYGVEFASTIGKGNIIGTQYHPEKSGKWGLHIIDNFFKYYTEEHAYA